MRLTGRGLATNLLVSLASVTLLLVALEVATRWIDPKLPPVHLPTASNCMRRNPLLSLDFRPGCTGVLGGTPHSTNGLGLRGPEARDDGSARILALGDSCTWGWHADQDQTYPAVLQRLLDARAGVSRYQVLNAGFPGYTSYQGLVYLREKGIALAPRVVIIGFGFNDAYEAGDIERQIDYERRHPLLVGLDDELLQTSKLYYWARWKSSGLEPDAEAGTARPRGAPRDGGPGPRVPLEKYISNLEDMVVTARDHGAQSLLLSFWPEKGGRGGRRMALGIVSDKWDVPLISYDGPRFDVVHPTVDGYRRLAAQILAQLDQLGVLK